MIAIMSSRLLQLFEANGRRFRCANGQFLFHAGDSVRLVWLLTEGQIALQRVTSSGATLILHRATAGRIVAEASAFSDCYHCDAKSLSESAGLSLARDAFLSALSKDAECAKDWAGELARGLHSARRRAEIRSLRTVSERLDAWLETGGTIPEKGCWQDLAAELGVSREALYRELSSRRA